MVKAQEGPEGEGVNGHFKNSHRKRSELAQTAERNLTEMLRRNTDDNNERKHGIAKCIESKLRGKTSQKANYYNHEG